MWAFVVMFSMAVAVGGLMVAAEARAPVAITIMDDHLARNMALYRSIVVEHVRTHPGLSGSVPAETLEFPRWYTPHPAWRNQVLENGTVVVYAAPVSPTLSARLAAMSQGSILAGEARQHDDGSTTLYTARQGDTRVALPRLDNGTVVWLSPRD
jgi:hypothetical protein